MRITPINEQPYFRRFNPETPVAHEIAKKILTLPLSPAHLDEEIEYVIHSFIRVRWQILIFLNIWGSISLLMKQLELYMANHILYFSN